MTDIRLSLGGVKFSVRVAILCVRDGKLLANTAPGLGFWFLPGGALATEEDALECAAREWLEETGTAPGPLRLVGVLESHFGPARKRQHELGFYFRMEAPPELPDQPFTVLDNADVLCEWVPVTEVVARPVYPLALTQLLAVPSGEVRHLVVRE